MPHDSNGNLLKEGDVVTMSFTVKHLSINEKACNVSLEALATARSKEQGEDYLPSMTCNTTLATKI